MMEFLEEIKKRKGRGAGGEREGPGRGGRCAAPAAFRAAADVLEGVRRGWGGGEVGVSPVCRAKCGTLDLWRGSWQEGGIGRGCERGSEFPP